MKKLPADLPIKTYIEEKGQLYVDQPVFKPVPVYCGKDPIMHNQLMHYKRVPLNWIKPKK